MVTVDDNRQYVITVVEKFCDHIIMRSMALLKLQIMMTMMKRKRRTTMGPKLATAMVAIIFKLLVMSPLLLLSMECIYLHIHHPHHLLQLIHHVLLVLLTITLTHDMGG